MAYSMPFFMRKTGTLHIVQERVHSVRFRFGRCVFEVLVNDILGNYVVQTMIRIAIELLNGKRQGSAHWFFELRKKVDAMAPQLEKRASGNKILALFKPYTLITMPS